MDVPTQSLESTVVDADLGVVVPSRNPRSWSADRVVLAVIAAGGAAGAAARYGIGQAWRTPAGAFPWTTLTINAVGCGLIGILMVLITDVWSAHRLVRPFLGTGILGGFTTFSTYTVDVEHLLDAGRAGRALGYLVLTVLVALTAVWAGVVATRLASRIHRRDRR